MKVCGRPFSEYHLRWIQDQVDRNPDLNRAQLSKLFCRHIGWLKEDGGLKEMSCRVAMLHLDRRGYIRLPVPRTKPRTVGKIERTAHGEPLPPFSLDAGRVELTIEPVERKTSGLWNELIDRYHYLGYSRMGGAQMRFFVRAGGERVALLGFSAAVWRTAPREAFIGWTESQRKSRLHHIVNNSRFLILPWVSAKNLASRILSKIAKRLPDYWHERYNYRPLLLETFVERNRFKGVSYKAANWICVGETLGRGKWDRKHAFDKPVKTIWLYPLDRRFRETLCR